MRHLINKLTGGDMWVADNREEEYLAAGHKRPAAVPVETVKPTEEICATSHKEVVTEEMIPEEKPVKTKSPGFKKSPAGKRKTAK